MAYHKSLQGVGFISIVPTDTYPDPIHLAEIDSLDFNINETDSDLIDSAGDVIDSFTSQRVIEGTISLKDISGSLLAAVTRGVTVTAASSQQGYSQTSTIPTTPFEIDVSASTAVDLGVINLTTGKAMTCAATATGTGVYAFNASTGVYTFNTADSGSSVLLTYRKPTTTASTTDIASVVSQSQTYFGLHCYNGIAAKPWGLYVPAARIPGIGAKFGKAGWSDVTLKWKATKDSNNKFVYLYTPE